MRGNEFLNKMELIDPAFVEEADQEPRKEKKTHEIRSSISKMCAKAEQNSDNRE